MRSPTRLLLVTLAAGLPSCERHSAVNDAAWWRLEGDRQDLVQKIALLQVRCDRAASSKAEMAMVDDEAGRLSQDHARLLAERDALSSDIVGLAGQVEDARRQWVDKKREAAVGKVFASLTSLSGRTYENVTITKVTDIGIEFRHPNGSARFAASDLSNNQLDQFGIEIESALAAHQKERLQASAYLASLDPVRPSAGESASSRKKAIRDDKAADEKKGAADNSNVRSGLAINSGGSRSRSRLSEPARPFGGTGRSYSRTYYYDPPTVYYGGTYVCPPLVTGRVVVGPVPAPCRPPVSTPRPPGPSCPPPRVTPPSRPSTPVPPAVSTAS